MRRRPMPSLRDPKLGVLAGSLAYLAGDRVLSRDSRLMVRNCAHPVPDSIQLLGLAGDHQGCVSYDFVTG